ncbi:BatD family protein, partial [Vibrio parahaemolyticus]
WQTLTFVFAGLWILTSAIAFVIWKKRPVASTEPLSASEKPLCVEALKRIINEGDEAKIERSVNEYLSTHHDRLNPEDVQAVKLELDAINRARFSPNQQPWSHKALLEKVQKLAKTKRDKSSHQLEKL